jgi:microcystin-dependent protein
MPAIQPAAHPGWAPNVDPAVTTVPPVPLTADVINTTVKELINVVIAGGLTPDPYNQSQLVLAIQNIISASTSTLGVGTPPIGGVIMFSGLTSSIALPWRLCDGTNGTPDLRGMFIVGAGGVYTVGQTGGVASQASTTDTQGSHAHTGSAGGYALTVNDIPPHTHTFNVISDGGTGSSAGGRAGAPAAPETTNSTGGGASHTHSISTDGSHLHNVTAFDNRPPFYALAYIIRVS